MTKGQENAVAVDQKEHRQIFPKPGWVEHDPLEIWARVQEVINALADIDAIKALWTYSTDGILYDLFITGGDQEGEHQRKYGNMIEFTAFVAAPPAP
jgi:hypothetical protein